MKKLYIYGNGGEGKNVALIAQSLAKYDEIVFINDFEQHNDFLGIKTVSFVEARKSTSIMDEFVVAVGEPYDRESLFQKMTESRCRLASSITYVGFQRHETVKMGIGTVIHQNVTIEPEAVIGKNCLINTGAIVGHNAKIGDHCVISPGTIIGGYAQIDDGVYIGSGAIIRDRVSVGSGSIVGMGSVVISNIENGTVAVGNPAKELRKNTTKRVFAK